MAYSKKEIESLFKEILRRISEEGKSVRAILLEETMPDQNTFYKWIGEDEEKKEQYAHACATRAEKIFEEIIEIADESQGDVITNKDGEERLNGEFVARSRLRVDARKWVLSKMQPKKYGDKIDVTSDGKEIKAPSIIIQNPED